MSFKLNPFTGAFDIDNNDPYPYYNIVAGRTIIVKANKEYLVSNKLTVSGIIKIAGKVSVKSHHSIDNKGPAVTGITVVTSSDSPYSILDSDLVLELNADAGDIIVLLPSVTALINRRLEFSRIDANTDTVTLTPLGSDTILGETDQTLNQWDLAILRAGSTSWL